MIEIRYASAESFSAHGQLVNFVTLTTRRDSRTMEMNCKHTLRPDMCRRESRSHDDSQRVLLCLTLTLCFVTAKTCTDSGQQQENW
jgi:hypothetical protein